MNKEDCQKLIRDYVSCLRKGFQADGVEHVCEVTTPFLDRHNDFLQVYARREQNKIRLTDDGYILSDLQASGLNLNTPKRKAVLATILNGFGAKVHDQQLVIEASPNDVGQRLHSLIQAMLAVNDMFVLAQPRVAGIFWEDVRGYLDEHDIRYSSRVKVSGKSGYDHAIDFLIPKSRHRPERFVQTVNAPTKNSVGRPYPKRVRN